MSKGSPGARTFFIVIHEKSLENMNINVNGWSDLNDIKEQLNKYFDQMEDAKAHYTAICTSAQGLKHIHEVVTFNKTKRMSSIAKLYGNAHSEVMLGTKEDAANYINKRGKFEEKGEIINLIWGDPEAIENNKGTRSDLKEFDKNVLDPNFNLDECLLTLNNERQVTFYKNRYFRIKKMNAQNFRKVEVYYIEGAAGSGKTRGAIERNQGHYFKASMDQRNNFPFDGYECQDVLILDELRPGAFTHSYLMQILDGYPLNINIKGGIAPACWTKVFITSALPLKEWYKGIYTIEDQKQQFMRRITHHYKAVNGKWYEYDAQTTDENIIP